MVICQLRAAELWLMYPCVSLSVPERSSYPVHLSLIGNEHTAFKCLRTAKEREVSRSFSQERSGIQAKTLESATQRLLYTNA